MCFALFIQSFCLSFDTEEEGGGEEKYIFQTVDDDTSFSIVSDNLLIPNRSIIHKEEFQHSICGRGFIFSNPLDLSTEDFLWGNVVRYAYSRKRNCINNQESVTFLFKRFPQHWLVTYYTSLNEFIVLWIMWFWYDIELKVQVKLVIKTIKQLFKVRR